MEWYRGWEEKEGMEGNEEEGSERVERADEEGMEGIEREEEEEEEGRPSSSFWAMAIRDEVSRLNSCPGKSVSPPRTGPKMVWIMKTEGSSGIGWLLMTYFQNPRMPRRMSGTTFLVNT
jgi:hypothetical protein